MAPPKGNKFWELRALHGREVLFATPTLLWEAACEYFSWCESNPIVDTRSFGGKQKVQRPFTMQGLCRYLNCNTAYFRQFKTNCSDDFSTIILNIEEAVYQQKFELAAIGVLKENLIARNLGISDKIKQESNVTVRTEPDFSDMSTDELKTLAAVISKLSPDAH